MIVRELITRLGFDADDQKVSRFDRRVANLKKTVVATSAAFVAAAGAAAKLAVDTARYGDEVAKTSRQLGLASEELQEYRFAFDRLGVSQGQADAALERFNRRLGQAREGTGQARDRFEDLGISLRDSEGEFRGMSDLLPEVADAMSQAEDAAQQAAIAQDFFGRSGGRLAMALAEGGDEIRDLREEFRLLGGGLTNEQTKAAELFTDSMTNMRTVLSGLRLQIGARLMPIFQPMMDAFTEFLVLNRELILERAHRAFDLITESIGRLGRLMGRIWGVITGFVDTLNNLIPRGGDAAVAIAALAAAFRRFPGVVILLGIVAALDDISAWMEGAPSAVEKIIGPFDEFAARIGSLRDALAEFLGADPDRMTDWLQDMAAMTGGVFLLATAIRGLGWAIRRFPLVLLGTALVEGTRQLSRWVQSNEDAASDFMDTWSKAASDFSSATGRIASGLKRNIDGIIDVFAGFGEYLTSVFLLDMDGMIDATYRMWNGLENAFAGWFEIITGHFEAAWAVIEPILDAMGFLDPIKAAWQDLSSAFDSILDSIGSAFEAVWERIRPVVEALQWVVRSGSDAIRSLRDGEDRSQTLPNEIDQQELLNQRIQGQLTPQERRRGGSVNAGPVRVGEAGEELLYASGGEFVAHNRALRQMQRMARDIAGTLSGLGTMPDMGGVGAAAAAPVRITDNRRVNITVPPGTSDEQIDFIRNEFERQMDRQIDAAVNALETK